MRAGNAVTGFRLTFDQPLEAYAFVRVSGCVALERWSPESGPVLAQPVPARP